MQGEYPADEGVRLHRGCGSEEAGVASGRLFLCAGCRGQVIICSCCDRGQIYCNGDCAAQARRQTLKAAGRRYQASQRGRMRHAARMGRYRSRQKKVTHHGSPAPVTSDLLMPVAMAAVCDDAPSAAGLRPARATLPLVWSWLPAIAASGVPASAPASPLPCWTRPDGAQTPW